MFICSLGLGLMSRGEIPYKVSHRNKLWIISVGQPGEQPWPLGPGL